MLKKLFAFFKKPDLEPEYNKNFFSRAAHSLVITFGLVVVSLIINIVLSILSSLISQRLYDTYLPLELFEGLSVWQIIFQVSIFAPLVEEVGFRGWLTENKKVFALSLFTLLTILVVSITPFDPVLAILFFILWVLVVTTSRVKLVNFISKYCSWLVYASSVLFALVHFQNFNSLASSPLVALLVLPQFIIGLVLSFVRIKWGLGWSVWIHGCYNLVILAITLLLG